MSSMNSSSHVPIVVCYQSLMFDLCTENSQQQGKKTFNKNLWEECYEVKFNGAVDDFIGNLDVANTAESIVGAVHLFFKLSLMLKMLQFHLN